MNEELGEKGRKYLKILGLLSGSALAIVGVIGKGKWGLIGTAALLIMGVIGVVIFLYLELILRGLEEIKKKEDAKVPQEKEVEGL